MSSMLGGLCPSGYRGRKLSGAEELKLRLKNELIDGLAFGINVPINLNCFMFKQVM